MSLAIRLRARFLILPIELADLTRFRGVERLGEVALLDLPGPPTLGDDTLGDNNLGESAFLPGLVTGLGLLETPGLGSVESESTLITLVEFLVAARFLTGRFRHFDTVPLGVMVANFLTEIPRPLFKVRLTFGGLLTTPLPSSGFT